MVASWILLGLAIVSVVYAFILHLLLVPRNLIIYKMSAIGGLAFIVVPPVITLGLAIVAVCLPAESHPNSWLVAFWLGYLWFALMVVFQGACTMAILEKGRDWKVLNKNRDLVK